MSKTPIRPRRTRKLQTTTARGSGRRSLHLVTHHTGKTEASAHLFTSGKGTMNDKDEVLIFASAFYDTHGYDRPLYTLAHNLVLTGPQANWLIRAGALHASPANAARALASGAVVLVFPGGDFDAFRPTRTRNTIDFQGRCGYVRTALEAGVPTVSICAQESQWFLARGDRLAARVGLHRLRFKALPLTFGFPFGLTTAIPPNLPLPSKIVTQVLEPIDVVARFGEDPDIGEVDTHVRSVMQAALDQLARQRRFPLVG